MRSTNTLVFASNNSHKLLEMRALLSKFSSLQLKPASSFLRNAGKIGKVEIYNTYLENAAAKARLVNHGCHYPTLSDDSGLEVEALNGQPGVFSQRYASLEGSPSQNDQDQANIQKLLKSLTSTDSRKARFVCTLSLIVEGVLLSATGELEGTIALEPKGTQGFGYDSIFIPQGETRTLAEMTETEKNNISHRAIALKKLFQKIEEHGIQIAKP